MADELLKGWQKLQRGIVRGVQATRTQIERDLRNSVATKYPPASAPGNPPARRTGEFHDSIHSTVQVNSTSAEINTYSTDPKAIYLEFGTDRMAPRPSFRPSMYAAGDKLHRNIRRETRGA